MKPKILILGSKGMAGHMIYFYLKSLQKYEVADLSRSDRFFNSDYCADIRDRQLLERAIENEQPDIVVNCTGILNKFAENNPEEAIWINSYLPHWLAKKAAVSHYKLIQISTDCVFNGRRGGYKETDETDGLDFYARSKALGEVAYGDHLTLRTSIIGPELKDDGIGLFDWFFRAGETVRGYKNVWWTGITTLQLAKSIDQAIEERVSGIYHLVNGERICKYDLLLLFKRVFERSTAIIPFETRFSDKSLIASRMELPVPSYSSMLEELRVYMEKEKLRYPNYFN